MQMKAVGLRKPILLPFRGTADLCSIETDDVALMAVLPTDDEMYRCCRRLDVDAYYPSYFPFSILT